MRGIAHNNVLLLATAWATLVTLCLGVCEAKERAAALAKRRSCGRIGKPDHARQSVFTLGLRRAQAWLYRTVNAVISWLLPEVDAASWFDRWHAYQSRRYIFKTVLP